MEYQVALLFHLLGMSLILGGCVAVFFVDLRARQYKDLKLLAEGARHIAVFYDGVVVPGAITVFLSGAWLIWMLYGNWSFWQTPWLAGMVGLWAFEFIEGNTITRIYFMRLRRYTRESLETGAVTAQLKRHRDANVPTFAHYLDIPIVLFMIALGVLRPATWQPLVVGILVSAGVAGFLAYLIPRLYPWVPEDFKAAPAR